MTHTHTETYIHTYIYIYICILYIYIYIYKISANTPTGPFIIKLVYMNIITYVLNGYTLDRAYVYIEMYIYIYIYRAKFHGHVYDSWFISYSLLIITA